MESMTPEISIITPTFNEEDSIELCIERVSQIMSEFLPNVTYEHIISDNASTDSTQLKLKTKLRSNKSLRVLLNSRNVGPVINIWSALKYAKGNYIIPFLPADLQDPADMIPMFYKTIIGKPELDVVFGVRKNRKEFFLLKLSRNIYYKLIRHLGGLNLPEHAGEFLITRRRFVQAILETNQEYPYIRGLIAQSASRFEILEYNWELRKRGKSKNNYWSLLDEAINGFISVSKIPARLALIFGFLLAVFGVLFALINLIVSLMWDQSVSKGVPTIIIGIFLFGGIQLAFLGLLGEYILSIHNQVKKTPNHLVIEL